MSKLSQELIISTYISLLTKSPWAEVSLSTIATELGVSEPALFHYFSSKQELDDIAFKKIHAEFEAMACLFETMDQREALLNGSYYMLEHIPECTFLLQLLIDRRLSTANYIQDKKIPGKGTPYMVYAMICFTSVIGAQILSKQLTRKNQIEVQVDQLIGFLQKGLDVDRTPLDPASYTVKDTEIGESKYLKALDKVLKQYGPRSVSIGNFAKALGVAPSTLYSTFKNKQCMLVKIASIEANRMLGIVESHLNGRMELPAVVETIVRTVDSYLDQQVDVALYIDDLYVVFSRRESFEAYPMMLKTYDALESICPGLGVCMVTLPASSHTIRSVDPTRLTMEQLLDYLYHGIKKELG